MFIVLSTRETVRPRAVRAFTLLEVVLAILIASGILVVALYFYQQATSLRSQLLQETERIATARLVMEKMTSELRTTPQGSSARTTLSGGSNFIRFLKTDLPPRSGWSGAALGRATSPETDLKWVSYRLESADPTNTTGVSRSEEPVLGTRRLPLPAADFLLESTNNVSTNALLLAEQIRWLSFRYWNGNEWQDSWTAMELPSGVEISLAAEPPLEMDTNAPAGLFRRVIYLPGSNSEFQVGTQTNSAEINPEPKEASL